MEEEKTAFVFDTNFILQNQKLNEVIKKIDKKYVPYVTQVSIEERKAQQCNDKKKAYERIKESLNQINTLVTLKDTKSLENELKKFKDQVQQVYEKFFEGTIIKYDISSDNFKSILQRAFDKVPPFNDSDNASDKGFKDTVMWLSIMNFFKYNGENEVVFLTDDKGFINKTENLTKEFEEYTGKKIKIKNNSSFETLFENKKQKESVLPKLIPNIENIREQLRDLLDRICWITEYNYYGDEEYYRSFLTCVRFDEAYIKAVLDNLDSIIQEHIFSDGIPASVILERDNRIYNDKKIDIISIEKLNKLYKEIVVNYPEHTSAFVNTITERLNENFEDLEILTDTEVPF